MNIVDIIIILFILFWGVIGFKRGFIKQTTMFIGLILILVLSFVLKNSVAIYMYEKLPFFNFFGIFRGVTVLNILLYELIAFFLVLAVLFLILKIFTFFSSIIEKILNFTIILGIPSKLLGFIVGLIEGYIVAFLILYFISLPIFNIYIIRESKFIPFMLDKTPILSEKLENTINTFEEIYSIKGKYKDAKSNDEFNKEALDILLKHNIITVESVEKLVISSKLKINNVEGILKKYR